MPPGPSLRLTLHQTPRIATRFIMECSVCRQEYTDEGRRVGRLLEAVLPLSYDVCICCRQEVPDPRDRNYRARARRWVGRRRREATNQHPE